MKFKRLLSALLIVLSITSLTIPAFADADYNGGGTGNSGGSNSVSYGSYDSCQQGYRVTIVDDKGNPVTIPVDFRYTDPEVRKKSYSRFLNFPVTYLWTCKTEASGSRSSKNNVVYITDMLATPEFKGSGNMPNPMRWSSGPIGQGKELRDWLMAGKAGPINANISGSTTSTPAKTPTGVTKTNNKNPTGTTGNTGSAGTSNNNTGSTNLPSFNVDATNQATIEGYAAKLCKEMDEEKKAYISYGYTDLEVRTGLRNFIEDRLYRLSKTGKYTQDELRYFSYRMYLHYQLLIQGTKTLSAELFNINDLIAYAANTNTESDKKDGVWILPLLEYQIDKVNVFQFTNGIQLVENSVVKTIGANGYAVLIEPIVYFVPLNSSGTPLGFWLYGTITNLSQMAVKLNAAGKSMGTSFKTNSNWANKVGPVSLYLEKDHEFEGKTIKAVTSTGKTLSFNEIADQSKGYALHIYTATYTETAPSTQTYDPEQGKNNHPAPDPAKIPLLEGEDVTKTRTTYIIKTYVDMDIKENETHKITLDREVANPNIIYIMNEPEYRVVKYITSKEYIKTTPETTWDEIEKTVPKSQDYSLAYTSDFEDAGQIVDTVKLGPSNDNEDIALYVKLVRKVKEPSTRTGDPENPTPHPAPDPSSIPLEFGEDPSETRKTTIIKYYENSIEKLGEIVEVEYLGPYIREDNPYVIDIVNEPEYKVDSWFITDTSYKGRSPASRYDQIKSAESSSTSRSGSGVGKVSLIDGESTLVVKLVKKESINVAQAEGDIILTESQVSKAIETIDKNIPGWGPMTASWGYQSLNGCRGHYCGNPFCLSCPHYCRFSITDSSYNLNLINTTALLPKLQADVGRFNIQYVQGKGAVGNRSSLSSGVTNVSEDNMKSVLWRGDDVPTLASYKESTSNTLLSLIGQGSIGNTPKTTRTTQPFLKYNLAISLNKNGSLGDYSTASRGSRGCRNYSTHNLNKSLDYKADVVVYSYSGKAKAVGDSTINRKLGITTIFAGKTIYPDVSEGFMFQTDQHIKWYPYVRMTHQVTGQKDPDRTNVNVLSQYISDILPNYYVESAWITNAEDNNLTVRSAQWSLHQKATNGKEVWQQKDKVLPGGAIYTLDTADSKTNVNVVTWQPYLQPEILNKVITEGKEYTIENAVKAHEDFAKQAEEAIESWRLVQMVDKDYTRENAFNGVNVTGNGNGGVSLSDLGLNGKTSTDSKYLLKPNSANNVASEGDIDIVQKKTITTYYMIKADISGNITISTSNDNSNWNVVETLTKEQNQDNIQSTAVKALEVRTHIIQNICTALNRNKGNDKTATWVTDGHWYNEAIDGICVVRQETCFDVGLYQPSKRTVVLDPNMCPPVSSKSGNYSTAFISQYMTADKSDKYPNKPSGFIGEFKGRDVVLANHQYLFTSNTFYIPNANVMDLAY